MANKVNAINISKEELDDEILPDPEHILTDEDIKTQLKDPKSVVKMTNREIYIFLTFVISFLVVCLTILDIQIHNAINVAIDLEFSGYDYSFDIIDNKYRFYKWANEIVGYCYQAYYYIGRNRERTNDSEIAYSNYYVSPIRFTLRRMKVLESPFKDFTNYIPDTWIDDGIDPTSGFSSNEDTTTFGETEEFTYTKAYNLPGYVAIINIFNESLDSATNKLGYLQNNSWIDSRACGIVADFVVFNPYLDVFTYIQGVITITKTGKMEANMKYYSLNKYYYRGYGFFVFREILEGIFIIILVVYVIQQPLRIFQVYAQVDDQMMEEAFAEEHNPKKEEVNLLEKGFDMLKKKVELVLRILIVYFTDLWNVLDALNIILSFVIAVLWLKFVVAYGPYNLNIGDITTAITNDDFYNFTQMLATTKTLVAYGMVVIFIRVLKYLGGIVERVTVLFDTLSKAGSDICHFMVLLMIVLLSFVLTVYIYFGSEVVDYSTFTKVITVLFQFMNWWYSSFNSLLEEHLIEGTVLFIVFMIFIVFILLNMFVGILVNSYRDANIKLKYKTTGCDETGKKIIWDIEEHPFYFFRNLVLYFGGFVYPRFEKMRNEFLRERKKYEIQFAALQDPSMEWDREYNPLKGFGAEKNKIPLTSKFIEAKANLERDRRCGRILYKALIYVACVVMFIMVLYLQIKVDLSYMIGKSARDILTTNIKFVVEGETGKYSDFGDIADLEYYSGWIQSGFPQFVNGYENKENIFQTIIGDEFRFSLRIGQSLHGKTNLDPTFVRLNDDSVLDSSPAPGERTDPIIGNVTHNKLNYTRGGGYKNQGGYFFYTSANVTLLSTEMQRFISDGIIGPDTWLLCIEFVTYEASTDMYAYSTIIFKTYSSGFMEATYTVFPLTLNQYKHIEDFIRLVLEALYMTLMTYYILNYFHSFFDKWIEYDAWYDRELPFFTPLQDYQRQQKLPEIARKVKYIFSIFRIIDLCAFAFSITGCAYWIVYVIKAIGLERSLPYNHNQYDYLEPYRLAANIFSEYINYSCVCLVFLAIRLLEDLQYAGNIKILMTTIFQSQEDIFYFLIIFISLMMGFAGMAYVAFGEYEPSFDSFADALLSCFIMLMGEFSTANILKNDLVLALYLFLQRLFYSHTSFLISSLPFWLLVSLKPKRF